MGTKIINRGRGPEIEDTRITVFDICDYTRQNWHRDEIAATLRLSSVQVDAALQYIQQHQTEVFAEYEKILARERRGNPPELKAKLDAIHQKWQARLAERTAEYTVETDDQNSG